MVFAWVLILLVVGSVAFHVWSPWYLTPLASNWGMIDGTIDITFWVTGFVFVAVNLFMAWCVIRYRYDKNRKAHYEPENKKLEWWLTGLTSLGVAAMLTPGLFVWGAFVTVPEDAHEFEAIGQQWYWSYRFPGEDGTFGTVASRFISNDYPFGMDPEDPNGKDDVLVSHSEVHLPIDQPVKANLRAKDVLHNFAVAQFRVKMDLVPGMVTYLWFTPTKLGEFEVLCQELCGIGHHTMRGMVVVDTQDDFDAWLARQPTYAETLTRTPGDAVAGQAAYAVCSACHGPQGEGNPVLNSPKTAGQEPWYIRRQLAYFKNGARGAHPEDTFGQQMAPMAATLASDAAVENVIAYIQTLPDVPSQATIVGNLDNGERLWKTCGACHGANGQGIEALNAPRLAGVNDWYLATQLKNFKAGIRGAHSQDAYGMQMRLMANILKTDQAVDDVVAYINTLPGAAPAGQQLSMNARID